MAGPYGLPGLPGCDGCAIGGRVGVKELSPHVGCGHLFRDATDQPSGFCGGAADWQAGEC